MDSTGIPRARDLIRMSIALIETRAAASDLKVEVLKLLAEAERHTWRKVSKRKSARVSRPMDRDLVQSILLAVVANPNASRKEIADMFGVQAGRVTEVVQGKHDKLLSSELRDTIRRRRENGDLQQLELPKVRNIAA